MVAAMLVLYEYKKIQLSNREKIEKKRQQIREEIDLERQAKKGNKSFRSRVETDLTVMNMNTDLDTSKKSISKTKKSSDKTIQPTVNKHYNNTTDDQLKNELTDRAERYRVRKTLHREKHRLSNADQVQVTR